MQSNDVLILGEEHNDKEGHRIKREIIEEASKNYAITVSMEMLEWHQQESLDEYLRGEIEWKPFSRHTPMWKNFETDYLPILNYAKTNRIPVLAANPPRKYVNKVSREGILAYQGISPQARRFLPLPQNVMRDRSSRYEMRLESIFSEMSSSHSMEKKQLERIILAQHIWDAGMAEKIAGEFFFSNRKIIHINGRFHSDYGLGVAHRLRKWGIRVLTVSLVPEERAKKENLTPSSGVADFLILTKQPKIE